MSFLSQTRSQASHRSKLRCSELQEQAANTGRREGTLRAVQSAVAGVMWQVYEALPFLISPPNLSHEAKGCFSKGYHAGGQQMLCLCALLGHWLIRKSCGWEDKALGGKGNVLWDEWEGFVHGVKSEPTAAEYLTHQNGGFLLSRLRPQLRGTGILSNISDKPGCKGERMLATGIWKVYLVWQWRELLPVT